MSDAVVTDDTKPWRRWVAPPPHGNLVFVVALLRDRRNALCISQLELDERIGAPVGMIGKYEAFIRRPSAQSLAEWAQALGCCITIAQRPSSDA